MSSELQRHVAVSTSSSPVHEVPDQQKRLLVWCNERCHKTDFDLRLQMQDLAGEAGLSLVPLKKAKRFAGWLQKHSETMSPYILVCEWREAKPCFEALQETGLQAPELLFCMPEADSAVRRARSWARFMVESSTLDVRVVEDMPSLQDELSAFASKPGSASSASSSSGLLSTASEKGDKRPTLRWADVDDDTDDFDPAAWGLTAIATSCSPSASSDCGKLADVESPEHATPASYDVPLSALRGGEVVADLLRKLCPTGDVAALQMMLHSAAPECYHE